jgi:hypothetical protein
MELLVAFIVGMIVMDVMWAWKLGIPQALYTRWKYRKVIKQLEEQEQQ